MFNFSFEFVFDFNFELDCSSTELPCRKKRGNYTLRYDSQRAVVSIQNNFPTAPVQVQDIPSPIQVAPERHNGDDSSSGTSDVELVHGRHVLMTTRMTNGSTHIGETLAATRLANKELEVRD